MLQLSPVLLIKAQAFLASGPLFPPEAMQALGFGACLQTYCSVCHNSESVSFLLEVLQLFLSQSTRTHTQTVCV